MQCDLHVNAMITAKLSSLWPIYIPSYNRASKAPLLNSLSKAGSNTQSKVTVVIRRSQLKEYQEAYALTKFRYAFVDDPGVGPARIACLEHARKHNRHRILMLDDDMLSFHPLYKAKTKAGNPVIRSVTAKSLKWPDKVHVSIRSLSAACMYADRLLDRHLDLSYGALRNKLFSIGLDTDVYCDINKGSFPSCAFLIDVDRFSLTEFPCDPFNFHGEDLYMYVFNLKQGYNSFRVNNFCYCQDYDIDSNIPLNDNIGRGIHIKHILKIWPDMEPYIIPVSKHSTGSIKRVGFNWRRLVKDGILKQYSVRTEDLSDYRI